jgi:benzoate/toluate 1,2-dioxygenase beta subunit
MPNPISAYGRSKLGGEVSVAAANPKHFIVRSSWLFGVGGKNFVETMLRLGDEQDEILVVSDQRGCPTSTADLGNGMVQLVETDNFGIHHMRGGGECTWFDFAAEIFDQAQMETRVMSATTEMMARTAPRPAYSVLGHGRDDVIELPPWQRSLRRYLDDREFEKWLQCYADDVVYWMPSWDDDDTLVEDPQRDVSLIYYANKGGLEDRVFRIRTERSSATSLPEPRTSHNIANVEVIERRGDLVDVRFNWHTMYFRYKTVDPYYGTSFYTIDFSGEQPLIRRKTVVLKNDYIHHVVDVYHF